jgi:hypothetical protein
MSRDYHDDLIRVYAGNRIANMTNVAVFQSLCRRFAGDVQFQAERHEVESAKKWVETALDQPMTQQELVQKSILLLVQTRGDNKQRDLCYELILAGYRANWTDARRQYFDAAWEKIKLEYDYFLSFTSRCPAGMAGDNPVNTAYKQFIIEEITLKEFNKADRTKMNLLALVAYKLLSQPRIKGFYFPHTQYDNTQTERKLAEACDNCLVFVQLVQTIMFEPPMDGGTNYCFFEWSRARDRFQGADNEKHILFVVAAPNRNEFLQVLPFLHYDTWHKHISNKDPPYLPEVQFRDNVTLRKIRKTFKEIILPEIRGAWFRLIEGVP